MRRGIYKTIRGNAAYVFSSEADEALDLDAKDLIPIEEVTDKFIREAIAEDDSNEAWGLWEYL